MLGLGLGLCDFKSDTLRELFSRILRVFVNFEKVSFHLTATIGEVCEN